MTAIFNSILIPVDFSINTEVAVKKCLEIIEHEQARIFLLHVEKPRSTWSIDAIRERFQPDRLPAMYYRNGVAAKLFEWQNIIQEHVPGVSVIAETLSRSNIEGAIIEKARKIKPDVIIMGKNARPGQVVFRSRVSPDRIARHAGFPVLIVKPGSIYNRTRIVVVPVGSDLPKKKMELIMALKKKYRISIHLVTVMKTQTGESEFSASALLTTYRFVRDVAHCPLEHEVLHGDNIAKSTLEYAQLIKADMLVVDSEKETRLISFFEKNISDELRPDSRLQILAV